MNVDGSENPQEPGVPAQSSASGSPVDNPEPQGGAGMLDPDAPIGFTAEVGGAEAQTVTGDSDEASLAEASRTDSDVRADAVKERS